MTERWGGGGMTFLKMTLTVTLGRNVAIIWMEAGFLFPSGNGNNQP